MIFSALLPIGGKGTRMLAYSDKPKLLLPFGNSNLLGIAIDKLYKSGITAFYFLTNRDAKEVNQYAKIYCDNLGVESVFLFETSFSGNFGCIYENHKYLPEFFVVSYPDILHHIQLNLLYKFFRTTQSDIVFVCRKSDHLHDSDKIAIDCMGRVEKLDSKASPGIDDISSYNMYGNCGIYVAKKSFFSSLCSSYKPTSKSIDLFQVITHNTDYDSTYNISAFPCADFILDVGTPSRFKQAMNEYEDAPLSSNKFLLLDRDGTLVKTVDTSYLLNQSQVSLNPHILNLYSHYTEIGYTPVVVSNQPQISFGTLSCEELSLINARIQELLQEKGLTEIYRFIHCPHHPHYGYPGEIKLLKLNCICRKPSIGMFHMLEQTCTVNPTDCIMIGNADSDQLFASNLGCKYIDANLLSQI